MTPGRRLSAAGFAYASAASGMSTICQEAATSPGERVVGATAGGIGSVESRISALDGPDEHGMA
jgi:hypothetical protein